eukprot:7252361-Heterocapsa_arctica.AAC.1
MFLSKVDIEKAGRMFNHYGMDDNPDFDPIQVNEVIAKLQPGEVVFLWQIPHPMEAQPASPSRFHLRVLGFT